MRRPLLVRPAWHICAVPSAVPPAGTGPPLRIYRWEKTTVVAVKIKLKRLGKIREPYYRIVVADARTKRDGRAIEEIGKYHPKAEPSFIEVNSERVQHWLSVGAQPTDPVRVLLKITGDWQKFTGEPGAEGTLRTAGRARTRRSASRPPPRRARPARKPRKTRAPARAGPGPSPGPSQRRTPRLRKAPPRKARPRRAPLRLRPRTLPPMRPRTLPPRTLPPRTLPPRRPPPRTLPPRTPPLRTPPPRAPRPRAPLM